VDAFSYLSVLLSIILGLAIAQLLQGVGQLLQLRGRVRWYWPAVVWMAMLLLIYVQSWWAIFDLRNVRAWTFAAFAIVLLQTVLEYLLAALLTPLSFGDGNIDLRSHYFAQSRAFFVVLAGVLVVSLAKSKVVSGGFPQGENLAFHLALLALSAVCVVLIREWAHRLVAVASLVLFVIYIARLFSHLE
jgi:hypothetical protein